MSEPTTSAVPVHLGIIPDGNRRWAKSLGHSTLEGHRRGVDVIKTIGYAAIDRGIKYITYYAFSTENWSRTPDEVKYLMDLFLSKISSEIDEIMDNDVRLLFVGSRLGLSSKLVKAIESAEERTASNKRGTMAICLNYGGQAEIADAVASVIRTGVRAEDMTADLLSTHMYAPDLPAVDMVVRTSGEHRLSGFMLWRAQYAELYFTDVHWPAFTPEHLDAALTEYADRQRRFGK